MKILSNNSGFTLMELVMSSVVVSIGLLVCTTLLYTASAYTTALLDEYQALEQGYLLELNLRKTISLAVRVPIVKNASFEGVMSNDFQCRSVNTTVACGDNANGWKEVGVFFREYSTGSPDVNDKHIAPTALWYKRPTHHGSNQALSTSGMLVLEMGGEGENDASAMTPSIDDTVFHSLSEFAVTREESYDAISSLEFNYTIRYHGATRFRSWCPTDEINSATCVFTPGNFPNFFDRPFNFKVGLMNNILRNTVGNRGNIELRPIGPIHFFKSLEPAGDF